jgi:WD40 repeat protein
MDHHRGRVIGLAVTALPDTSDASDVVIEVAAPKNEPIDSQPQLIVSCSEDHTVRVWKRETGEEVGVMTGHEEWVLGCCIRDMSLLPVEQAKDNEVTSDAAANRSFVEAMREGDVLSVSAKSMRLWSVLSSEQVQCYQQP